MGCHHVREECLHRDSVGYRAILKKLLQESTSEILLYYSCKDWLVTHTHTRAHTLSDYHCYMQIIRVRK